MIRLLTVGDCAIEIGGSRLTPESELLFSLCLYLACNEDRRVSRLELLDVFWPSVPEARRRHSLRQALYRLRQFGLPLESDGKWIRIPFAAVESMRSNTAEWARILSAGESRADLIFLPYFAPTFSRAFDDWLEGERQRVHAELRRILLDEISVARASGARDQVERAAQLCLAIDPLNEEAVLALAEAFAMAGRHSQAVSTLDQFLVDRGPRAAGKRDAIEALRRKICDAFAQVPDGRTLAESNFVGRATLLGAVSAQLSPSPAGRGVALLLFGEAGIGKTRLANELTLRASLEGCQIVRLQAHAGDAKRPLAALIDLVPVLLQLPGALGTGPDALRCLDRIVRHEADTPTSVDAALSSDDAFARIQDAFVDLFEAVHGERRLLLCIEDAHCLDQMSLALIGRIAALADERGWFLVATVRSGVPLAGIPQPLLDDRSFLTIRVPPLDSTESRALLRILLGPNSEFDKDLEEWCLAAADGNPLFIAELARHYLQTGERASVPPSLTQLLERRLRTLSPPALLLLQCIAVFGKSCSVRNAEAALQFPRHVMVSALDELGHEHLLTHSGEGLACHHDLLAESAMALLSAAGMAHLHRVAGAVLEGEYSTSRSFGALWHAARHWSLAGDRDRALALACQCGHQLLDIGLADEAVRVFRNALEFCATELSKSQVLRSLADAQLRAGHWAGMVATLERRKGITVGPNQIGHSGHDEAHTLEGLWRSGASCDEITKRVSAACQSQGFTLVERAEIIVLGLKYADNVVDIEMVETMRARLDTLRATATLPADLLLQAEVIYHASYGDLTIAADSVRDLLQRVRGVGNAFAVGRTLRWAADTLRRAGYLDEAWKCGREAVKLAEDRSLPTEALSSVLSLAALGQHTDLWNEVDMLLPKARHYASLAAPHDPWAEPAVYALLARSALQRRDLDALRALGECHVDDALTSRLTRARAKLRAIQCDVANALVPGSVTEESLAELLDLHKILASRGDQDYLTSALIRALLALDRRAEAREIVDTYATLERRERYALPVDLQLLKDSILRRTDDSIPAASGRLNTRPR